MANKKLSVEEIAICRDFIGAFGTVKQVADVRVLRLVKTAQVHIRVILDENPSALDNWPYRETLEEILSRDTTEPKKRDKPQSQTPMGRAERVAARIIRRERPALPNTMKPSEMRRIVVEILKENPDAAMGLNQDDLELLAYFLTPIDPVELSDKEADLPSTRIMKQHELFCFIKQGIPEGKARELVCLPSYIPAIAAPSGHDDDYIPNPQEIEAACAAIRANWTDDDYEKRALGGTIDEPWELPQGGKIDVL